MLRNAIDFAFRPNLCRFHIEIAFGGGSVRGCDGCTLIGVINMNSLQMCCILKSWVVTGIGHDHIYAINLPLGPVQCLIHYPLQLQLQLEQENIFHQISQISNGKVNG